MDVRNILQQFVIDIKAGLLSYKRRCRGLCRALQEDTQKAYTVGCNKKRYLHRQFCYNAGK